MLQISEIKLSVDHTKKDLDQAVMKALRLKGDIPEYRILKKSLDARKKEELKYTYSVWVSVDQEENLLKKLRNKRVTLAKEVIYSFPITAPKRKIERPIIVGTGPAGLFCGYMLAKAGYKPLLLERGGSVDERVAKIEEYWKINQLDPECNVQFGEGGAGTFSDGKLNTGVKDREGKNRAILETFVKFGAPEEILYWNKPHIGTDMLRMVVKNMRTEIEKLGGEVRFHAKLTDLEVENEALSRICINSEQWIPCHSLILALGHSARDTFSMLHQKQLIMTQKAFAIGVRAEHQREMINQAQYGEQAKEQKLPTADYKLIYHATNGRSVYSFCMCPGGYVVNASSELGGIAVNGMSYYHRDGENSNAAIVVNVTPEDFADSSPLAGVEFQRKWERLAYQAGNGKVPVQLLKDLKANKKSNAFGAMKPSIQGQYSFANLRDCLPEYVFSAILEGMEVFDSKIKGYGQSDTILVGVETRTSSPLRMERDEDMEANIRGIYPCGEGAGYAGGIMSAALDGIRVAEAFVRKVS